MESPDVGVSWYLEKFRMLETSRGQNDYIPISEIFALANNIELFGSKEQFVSIIQALDDAYVITLRKRNGRTN